MDTQLGSTGTGPDPHVSGDTGIRGDAAVASIKHASHLQALPSQHPSKWSPEQVLTTQRRVHLNNYGPCSGSCGSPVLGERKAWLLNCFSSLSMPITSPSTTLLPGPCLQASSILPVPVQLGYTHQSRSLRVLALPLSSASAFPIQCPSWA